MMYEREKSDSAKVAKKPANKAGQPAAERVERRAEAKGRSTCGASRHRLRRRQEHRYRVAASGGNAGRDAFTSYGFGETKRRSSRDDWFPCDACGPRRDNKAGSDVGR